MWKMIGILLAAAVITAKDLPGMLRQRDWKELITYCILLSFGTTICVLFYLQYSIPNPAELIIYLYKPMSDKLDAILK